MVKMIKKLMHDAIINIQTELHSCLSYAVVLMRNEMADNLSLKLN